MGIRELISSTKRAIFRALNAKRSNAIHLFLLCPPLSGSTATKELIKTSPNTTCFPGMGEGQMLPGLSRTRESRRRWDPTFELDWATIKPVFYSHWSPAKSIRFEKSPANVMRAGQLEREFPNSYFLISIRNPYAFAQGFLCRDWGFDQYGVQVFVDRSELVAPAPAMVADFWVRIAQVQIANTKRLDRHLFYSYEELADDSAQVIKKMINFLPELQRLRTDISFDAHNIEGLSFIGFQNLNAVKIAKLSEQEVDEINRVLVEHQDVLAFFKYDLIQT